ncbi:MAG: UDP-N-acetylmuramate--L-alanine ligase [Cytophagales bacterium]|nr:UDP-N-acetylmuramate--L-alanine ligase [Cytophagales bacterium]
MKIKDKHIVYFLGIGGIGMSALARWFMHLGKKVYGYDKTETPLTQKLVKEGAIIHYEDAVDRIPVEVLNSRTEALIVVTPAIPKDHNEYSFLLAQGFETLKRSEVLGLITNDLFSVAVAGTHGKTTTSSMIAHILKTVGKSSVSLMGGILQGYESNLILEGHHGPDTIAVLEADEYDRSFLRLTPDIAVVTSIDPDHLDIYGNHEEMKSSFRHFIDRVKSNGHLFINEVLDTLLTSEKDRVTRHTYALRAGNNKAENIHISGSDFVFDYQGESATIQGIKLQIPGYHNIENAVAAISVSLQLGIDPGHIKSAMSSFKGVKRRFEYQIRSEELIYIDDYAHHPSEIKALLGSVKSLYPNKKVLAIFQPHLFTRTRDFADGFAESLDAADEIIMMDIYPARELPLEGITSQIIIRNMRNPNRRLVADKDLLGAISRSRAEVYLTVGAGDIDRFVDPIKKILEKRL